jgi:hypothetical protein
MQSRPTARLGLALGAVMGFAYLVFPISVFPGLIVWVLLLQGSDARLPAIAGGLVGYGVAVLLLIGGANLACANDPTCAAPVVMPLWLALGLVPLALGLMLALVARSAPQER